MLRSDMCGQTIHIAKAQPRPAFQGDARKSRLRTPPWWLARKLPRRQSEQTVRMQELTRVYDRSAARSGAASRVHRANLEVYWRSVPRQKGSLSQERGLDFGTDLPPFYESCRDTRFSRTGRSDQCRADTRGTALPGKTAGKRQTEGRQRRIRTLSR